MNSLRNVSDDILHNWLIFRDDKICKQSTDEDSKHDICFDEIYQKILENVPEDKRDFIKNELDLLDKEFLDYSVYWNEKYYRNGFCDGVSLVVGATK